MLSPYVAYFGLPLPNPLDNRVATFLRCYGLLLDNVQLHGWHMQHLLDGPCILTSLDNFHRNEFLKFEAGQRHVSFEGTHPFY